MSRVAPRATGPATPARTQLTLESLAERLVPTVAPQITGFSVTQLGGGLYRFSGSVVDDQSTFGLTVEFSGDPVSVDGSRADVTEDGSFELIVALTGGGADVGTVWATTEDYDFLASDPVSVYVDPT